VKAVVLFIAMPVLSGCVSTNAFNALQKKIDEMEQVQKLNTTVLAKMVKIVEVHNGDILELAKAANFLFKQLKDVHNQLMVAEAGMMQSNKDLADLDEKLEKLGKRIRRSFYALNREQKQLAEWQGFLKKDLRNLRKRLFLEVDYMHEMIIKHEDWFRKYRETHE